MLYAMIDIGSNTIRLAVYQIEGETTELLMKKKHTVGLASYIKDGAMQQAGIDKAVEILTEYQSFLAAMQIKRVAAFTTAALRNAVNGKVAVREIEERTGLIIEIISGDEEAEYDFLGATHGLESDNGLLVDVGGASTELVYFQGGVIKQKASLAMGSLGYRTLYVKGLMPSTAECAVMRREAETAVREATDFAGLKSPELCGIGGTFKGILSLYNAVYDLAPENRVMETARFGELLRRFAVDGIVPPDNAILLMKNLPDRIHTFLPGLVIADTVAKFFQSSAVTYSNSGMREGYIYRHVLTGKEALA
ncbi:MAG: exopolyphosphatase [Selenomonadaceae bacterium]|nr:exopolyphosphatase [Selenomonadaceae bacterium]